MKIGRILMLLIVSFCCNQFYAQTALNGNYHGKNLYIQNPMNPEGGYCVDSITINNKTVNVNMKFAAFEIDLTTHQLTEGDTLIIKIFHPDNCLPKILNPEAIAEVKQASDKNN